MRDEHVDDVSLQATYIQTCITHRVPFSNSTVGEIMTKPMMKGGSNS